MKKILICAYSLNTGGIETSLINLLKEISKEKCDITLMLQKKEGLLLKQVPKKIKIIEYKLSTNRNIILRKIYNRFKLIRFINTNRNKFDVSICYATYDYPSSIITRKVSKKSIMWVHSDYYNVFDKNITEYNNFFKKRKVNKFNKIVFVSNEARKSFVNLYKNLNEKTYVVNNLIDHNLILNLSKEKHIEKRDKPLILFVGRLEEESKGLTLLLDVAKESHKYDFWIIGDGKDKTKYQKYIKNKNINNVRLLGQKLNPYIYMKVADVLILPSIYEGFPVVTLEGLLLNKKIITTVDVSSNNFKLSDYVYLVHRDKTSIKKAIEDAQNKKHIRFDYKTYNKFNLDLTKKIILGDSDEI